MPIPVDELSLLIREWYYAASEGKVQEFFDFFVKDDRAVYIGTDPHEVWYGFEQIKINLEENFKTYGRWTIMSKNLIVQEFGNVAGFTDEVELAARLQSSSIAEDARMSGVLIRENQKWKILQIHFSFGISNTDLLPG